MCMLEHLLGQGKCLLILFLGIFFSLWGSKTPEVVNAVPANWT
jgi:hypothetical protein